MYQGGRRNRAVAAVGIDRADKFDQEAGVVRGFRTHIGTDIGDGDQEGLARVGPVGPGIAARACDQDNQEQQDDMAEPSYLSPSSRLGADPLARWLSAPGAGCATRVLSRRDGDNNRLI